MELKDYKDLCNALIDDMCEFDGIPETIEHLYNLGINREQLLELDFDESDIDGVIDDRQCQQAYDLYLQDFYKTHDKDMECVSYNEFYNNEWQDEEIKQEYIKKIGE